jgi:hypothetical protein
MLIGKDQYISEEVHGMEITLAELQAVAQDLSKGQEGVER